MYIPVEKRGKIIICTRNCVRMYRLSDRRDIHKEKQEMKGKEKAFERLYT